MAGRRAIGELVLRVISAAVLIPFALYVVWAGDWWLSFGAGVFAAAMGFEWSRMSGHRPAWLLIVSVGGLNLLLPLQTVETFCALLLVAAVVFALVNRRDGVTAAFGVLYAGGMPFALQLLRGGPWDGQGAALILMATVWASDSAAYFAGRGFGGPALTSDSPNKTWSGAIGAVFAGMLCGLIAAGLLSAGQWVWALAGGCVSVVAQLGDLFESQLKRRFGVKDASGLVPGHGGVMDRVDGLGAVCIVAVTVFLAAPGIAERLGL